MTNKPMLSVGREHSLKIHRKPFLDLESGAKTCEIRDCSDRDFQVGDIVLLMLVDETGNPTPNELRRKITHIQTGYGLPDDLCVLSYEPAAQHQGEPVSVVATPPSKGSGTMKLIELIAATITIWPADVYCFAQDSDGYCFSFKKEPLANGSCWDGRVASEIFLAERCVDSATTFVTRQQWEAYRLGFKQKSEQPGPVAVVMPERSNQDYAIEHAEYMAQSADDVLAKYQAYGLALLAVDEGGDDGEGELFEAIDTARGDLQESLVDLRGMIYELRKRANRCTSL